MRMSNYTTCTNEFNPTVFIKFIDNYSDILFDGFLHHTHLVTALLVSIKVNING